eukprot:2168303-Rhodomonas_salina.3
MSGCRAQTSACAAGIVWSDDEGLLALGRRLLGLGCGLEEVAMPATRRALSAAHPVARAASASDSA